MGKLSADTGLNRALRNPELLSMLSPLLAASFGVVPIKRQPDAVMLASFPGMSGSALRALQEILGVSVAAFPTSPRLMHEAIECGYFGESREGVNFNTFLDADFLDDPENLSKLASEKSESIGSAICTLPDWEVLLLDMDYRSKLVRLDLPSSERPGFIGGPLDIVMRSSDTGTRLYSPLRPLDHVCLVVQSFEFRDGQGGLMAKVAKKWAGLGKELFTSADNYMLEIDDKVPAGHPARYLILGAVLCIDIVLKE